MLFLWVTRLTTVVKIFCEIHIVCKSFTGLVFISADFRSCGTIARARQEKGSQVWYTSQEKRDPDFTTTSRPGPWMCWSVFLTLLSRISEFWLVRQSSEKCLFSSISWLLIVDLNRCADKGFRYADQCANHAKPGLRHVCKQPTGHSPCNVPPVGIRQRGPQRICSGTTNILWCPQGWSFWKPDGSHVQGTRHVLPCPTVLSDFL